MATKQITIDDLAKTFADAMAGPRSYAQQAYDAATIMVEAAAALVLASPADASVRQMLTDSRQVQDQAWAILSRE